MPGNQSSSQVFSLFRGMTRLPMERIFDWLPKKDKFSFFQALGRTHGQAYKHSREAAAESLATQFLQLVADANLKEAEDMLKFVQFNPEMLRRLLTANKECIQLCGLPMRGTALEIALKCMDTSCCRQEEMAEMLMRYMRKLKSVFSRKFVPLPRGEKLIQYTMQKLYPNGKEAHLQAQKVRALQFAKEILEPLATLIKAASPQDIALVRALTYTPNEEVDAYIENTLSNNELWRKLVTSREDIRKFIQSDVTYNPFYLQKAFEIVDEKYHQEQWKNRLEDGWQRLGLLSILGVGRIQACSPTTVMMLFNSGALWDFCEMRNDPAALESFKALKRNIEFQYRHSAVMKTGSGILLLGETFWVGPGVYSSRGSVCTSFITGGGSAVDFYVKQLTRNWPNSFIDLPEGQSVVRQINNGKN